jgi:hypothetical protein
VSDAAQREKYLKTAGASATSKIGFIAISRNQPRETAAAIRRRLQIVTKKSFAHLKEHAK